MAGRFITFEGIDGAGKSTHIDWFVEQLSRLGHQLVVTREPGGNELSEQLRELLLHQAMTPLTELLLVFAARNEHLQKQILPAIAADKWVICDRFTDSTWAYQGGGRDMPGEQLAVLEQMVHGGFQPHRTYLFDLSPDVAQARREAARTADRFEALDIDFFCRVRDAYRQRAKESGGRFLIIDGAQTRDDIRAALSDDIARYAN